MIEAVPTPNNDRYKTLVVILTVITTVITATVAGLAADANIRASVTNRDSQLYAILLSGELHRQGLQTAYDMNVFASFLTDEQEATVSLLTASQQSDSSGQVATTSMLQSAISQARADAGQKFSIFYTDPRYAPTTSGGLPDTQAYLTDTSAPSNDLLAKQNAASDEYDRWNNKGSAYTNIIAILAVAFFLFGLAQALPPRLRLLFSVFGLITLLTASLWTILVLIK